MQYFFTPGNTLAEYLSCGCFVSELAFLHPRRQLDHFVLLYGLKGELPIMVDGREFCVGPDMMLLLPADSAHWGAKPSTPSVSYYWCHFSCHETYALLDDGPSLNNGAYSTGILLPVFAKISDPDRVILIFQQLMHIAYMRYSTPHAADYSLMSLLTEFCEQTAHPDPLENCNQVNLSEIKEWIRINLKEPLTVQLVAKKFQYSPDYLSSLFRKHMGTSISRYIRDQRIQYAKELLLRTNLQVQEISSMCGYNDEKYFMRQFKAVERVSPTNFRHAYTERHLNNR